MVASRASRRRASRTPSRARASSCGALRGASH
jgi:hypothetical protein